MISVLLTCMVALAYSYFVVYERHDINLLQAFQQKQEDKFLLSAAIHIGTERSWYAFSFRDNPKKISEYYQWKSIRSSIQSYTSTSILLNPEKQFDSFGCDAEEKYSNLTGKKKHHGWLLFHNFASAFYNLEVNSIFLYFSSL